MKPDNIIKVIDELGETLLNYQQTISLKQYEIDTLKRKLDDIEKYIEYYTEQEVTEEEYKKHIK